jgi:hypothetical protein
VVQASNLPTDNGQSVNQDSALLRAAQQIYQKYEGHPRVIKPPIGVAVHRTTYRGRPVFSEKPILLPLETLITVSEIEDSLG